MHEGAAHTLSDAILRHSGEASLVAKAYFKSQLSRRLAVAAASPAAAEADPAYELLSMPLISLGLG